MDKKCRFFRPFRDLFDLVSLKNPALKRWTILNAKASLPEDIVGAAVSAAALIGAALKSKRPKTYFPKALRN